MYYNGINEDGYPYILNEDGEDLVILSDKKTPSCANNSFWIFQYYYDISGDEMIEVAKWAEENLKYEFLIGCCISGIVNEEDAILFKLTWECENHTD